MKNKSLLFALFIIICAGSFTKCKKKKETSTTNTVTPPVVFIGVVGDAYQGGKVAYLFQSGDPGYDAAVKHGLIAALTDQSTSIQWGGNITTGATSTGIGTGSANTNAIVANLGAGTYAAKLCADLVIDSYSDWYLPSKIELEKLRQNQSIIGGFAPYYYWSSTESDIGNAWLQDFGTGFQAPIGKSGNEYVRAIRKF